MQTKEQDYKKYYDKLQYKLLEEESITIFGLADVWTPK
jgi:hypothetical protein